MPRRDLPYAEARLLKALAHPVRMQIARILAQEESCVCHLEARLRLRQAYLSQQLAVLRAAGLIAERKVGTFVYYRLEDPGVLEIVSAARAVTGSSEPALRELGPTECGCPRCGERTQEVRIRAGGR